MPLAACRLPFATLSLPLLLVLAALLHYRLWRIVHLETAVSCRLPPCHLQPYRLTTTTLPLAAAACRINDLFVTPCHVLPYRLPPTALPLTAAVCQVNAYQLPSCRLAAGRLPRVRFPITELAVDHIATTAYGISRDRLSYSACCSPPCRLSIAPCRYNLPLAAY